MFYIYAINSSHNFKAREKFIKKHFLFKNLAVNVFFIFQSFSFVGYPRRKSNPGQRDKKPASNHVDPPDSPCFPIVIVCY